MRIRITDIWLMTTRGRGRPRHTGTDMAGFTRVRG